MIRKLYDWTMSLAAHRYAPAGLFGVAFIESSFFPIPPLIMLIPMVLENKSKAWFYALICTIGSVLGGLFGYFVGAVLFDILGKPILDLYGYAAKFDTFAAKYNDYGAWAVLFAGITPFPYKVITIASGATGLSLAVFTAASIVARAIQFFVVAGLLYWFGPPIREFIERRLGLVFTVFMVLLIGGFVSVKYLV
ncbi:MAG: YqaA family protein [Hyphomicrobiaceae bacterium]